MMKYDEAQDTPRKIAAAVYYYYYYYRSANPKPEAIGHTPSAWEYHFMVPDTLATMPGHMHHACMTPATLRSDFGVMRQLL